MSSLPWSCPLLPLLHSLLVVVSTAVVGTAVTLVITTAGVGAALVIELSRYSASHEGWWGAPPVHELRVLGVAFGDVIIVLRSWWRAGSVFGVLTWVLPLLCFVSDAWGCARLSGRGLVTRGVAYNHIPQRTCLCPHCRRMGIGRSGTEMEVDGCEILQETNDHERHLIVHKLLA